MFSKRFAFAICVGFGLLNTHARTSPNSDSATTAQKAEDYTAENARINKALDKIVTVEFLDTPIKEFADVIEEKAGIQVEIDRDVLHDAALVDPDPITVTLELRRVPIRRVLKAALGPLKLSYLVRDGVLLITTLEKATEVADGHLKGRNSSAIATTFCAPPTAQECCLTMDALAPRTLTEWWILTLWQAGVVESPPMW